MPRCHCVELVEAILIRTLRLSLYHCLKQQNLVEIFCLLVTEVCGTISPVHPGWRFDWFWVFVFKIRRVLLPLAQTHRTPVVWVSRGLWTKVHSMTCSCRSCGGGVQRLLLHAYLAGHDGDALRIEAPEVSRQPRLQLQSDHQARRHGRGSTIFFSVLRCNFPMLQKLQLLPLWEATRSTLPSLRGFAAPVDLSGLVLLCRRTWRTARRKSRRSCCRR